MLTFDEIRDRTSITIDDIEYVVIVAVSAPGRRDLVIYSVDDGQVAGLAFLAQPDVYWVTLPLDDRVIYTGNDVAEAIRWLTLEDRM
ncbi:hypothetical protein [Nonomuraea soli]|uniref:Uncharacterized protein n=1 Tax=Nonomuraea soli TaxID=1032476 RepID=A0A7W0CUQ5_9ACTN|nr:hypothetical protein [Nonomuraea soli]MBA2897703.1 hypothetical protein [Nonomuraea soli]